MAEVTIHREGVAGRITLNRPQALHALNEEMCLAIDAALKLWADETEVELVVVDHAAGTRGFCAGGDIRMLAESGAADGSAAQAFFRAINHEIQKLRRLRRRSGEPVVERVAHGRLDDARGFRAHQALSLIHI